MLWFRGERVPLLGVVCLLLWASWDARALDCRHLYRKSAPKVVGLFEPWLGEFAQETPEGRYYLLGSGIAGGYVYRVVPKRRGETYLEKQYRRPVSKAKDLALMQALKEKAADQDVGFRIPKFENIDESRVRIEDVAGRNLHSLLMDPKVAPELKTRLKEAYEEKVERYRRFLTAEFNAWPKAVTNSKERIEFLSGKDDGTSMYNGALRIDGHDGGVSYLIKSDNVIVHYDSTLDKIEMTLIDPL